MWDSIKWLIPTIKVPTWQDGIVAIGILIVGFALIRWIIRPLIMKCAKQLDKRNHPVMSDMAKNIYPSLRNALIFSLFIIALSLLVEVWLFDNVKLRMLINSFYVFFAFKALYDILGFYLENPERFETGKDQDILTPFSYVLVKY